jgi:hypothetical protein
LTFRWNLAGWLWSGRWSQRLKTSGEVVGNEYGDIGNIGKVKGIGLYFIEVIL